MCGNLLQQQQEMNTRPRSAFKLEAKMYQDVPNSRIRNFLNLCPTLSKQPSKLQNQAGASEMHTAEKQGALVHFRQCIVQSAQGHSISEELWSYHIWRRIIESKGLWEEMKFGSSRKGNASGSILQGLTQCLAHRRCSTNSCYMTNEKNGVSEELKSFCVHWPPTTHPLMLFGKSLKWELNFSRLCTWSKLFFCHINCLDIKDHLMFCAGFQAFI